MDISSLIFKLENSFLSFKVDKLNPKCDIRSRCDVKKCPEVLSGEACRIKQPTGFETKFQYTASRSSRILSSQEAASFCSSLIFRLFFPAYLRLENIFFSSFSRGSRLSFHPVLPFARIGMQNDVMSLGKSLDSARLVLVTINIIQTVIVSLPPRRKTKMHCRQK